VVDSKAGVAPELEPVGRSGCKVWGGTPVTVDPVLRSMVMCMFPFG
jgi:hypothetical protein